LLRLSKFHVFHKAKELGVPVIDEAELLRMLNG